MFLPFDLHDVSARPPLSQQHFSVTSFQCPLLRILITQFIKRVVYNPDSKSSCLLIFLKTSNDFSDLFDILRTLQDTPPLSVESLPPSPHRCLRYRFTHFDRDQVHHNSIVPPLKQYRCLGIICRIILLDFGATPRITDVLKQSAVLPSLLSMYRKQVRLINSGWKSTERWTNSTIGALLWEATIRCELSA